MYSAEMSMALWTLDRVAHVSPFWPIVYHFGEHAGAAASAAGQQAAEEAAAAEQDAKARGVSAARASSEPTARQCHPRRKRLRAARPPCDASTYRDSHYTPRLKRKGV
jgi:hypothetical protein